MTIQDKITFRIRSLCKEKEITPNYLAKISGVPQATIKSVLLHESKNPGIVTLQKICCGLNISLSDFLKSIDE